MNELYCVLKRSHVVDAFPRWESIEYFEEYNDAKEFVLNDISGLTYMDIVAIVSAEHVVDAGDHAEWLGVVTVNGELKIAPRCICNAALEVESNEWLKTYESNDDSTMYVTDMIDLMSDNKMVLACLLACFEYTYGDKKSDAIEEIISGMHVMADGGIVDFRYYYDMIEDKARNYMDSAASSIGYAFEYVHFRTTKGSPASRHSLSEFFNSCAPSTKRMHDLLAHEREMAEIIRTIAPVSLVILSAIGEYHELQR